MMEKRMKELESKVSSLVSEVSALKGVVQELKDELNLKVNKSVLKQTITSIAGYITTPRKPLI
ncbi:hypothetical protein [Niallia circulans]|nr:hypothetical protein [Niallia circulans]